jgi:hypothetical protein
MKTKTLIKLLQEADPTGEEEVCVGNVDIFDVHPDGAYYDGALQVLVRDDKLKPFWDIVGGKYVRTGKKIQIHTLSIQDLLLDDPEAPIEYIGCGENSRYETQVEKWREEYRKLNEAFPRTSSNEAPLNTVISVIDLTQAEAEKKYSNIQVTTKDGVHFPFTCQFLPTRLKIELKDGKVISESWG